MSSPQEIAMRILEQGSTPSDDWTPPAEWLEVPEPNELETYILIAVQKLITTDDTHIGLFFSRASDGSSGYGTIQCDWGDGSTESVEKNSDVHHKYTSTGQYLIKISLDENTNYISGYSSNKDYCSVQIIKFGSGIYQHAQNSAWTFGRNYANYSKGLKYLKTNNPEGFFGGYRSMDSDFFGGSTLRRVDMPNKLTEKITPYCFYDCPLTQSDLKNFVDFDSITVVGDSAFNSCVGLREIDLPNCTSIGANSFYDCKNLREINLPNCKNIGASAFNNCRNLEKITLADGCVFGTNCFQSCYSLYPRPDGSIN